ncbi:MAG: MFS transporter [Steroidobacteraceae bacterium]
MLAALRSLPRTVWLIGLISLVNDSASEMLYPLVPLYLTSVLMAGPRALGLIEGIAEATASLLKLLSGVIMDHTRRARPWILGGYGLAALGRPLVASVTNWPWLLALRFADRVGKGLRTSPRDALLAASVPRERRGLAFGVHRAMDNAGAVIGPLAATALLAGGVPLRAVFLWSAIPGAVCIALGLALREAPTTAPAASLAWHPARIPPALRRYLAVVALFTLGNSSNMFLLLRARELGVAPALVPLLWAAVSAVAALFSAPLSSLSDRWGRRRLLFAGYVAYGLVYLGMALAGGRLWLLLALFACYGLFLAATEGVEKALVADLAEPGGAGSAFGWFNLASGAMLLPASLACGWIYQRWSAPAAFGFSAACAFAAALLLPWSVRRRDAGR